MKHSPSVLGSITSYNYASEPDAAQPAQSTTVYDALGRPLLSVDRPVLTPELLALLGSTQGGIYSVVGPLKPAADAGPVRSEPLPSVTHIFEFRLAGTAVEEKAVPLALATNRTAVVALQSVEVSLARGESGEQTPGLVSGVTVQAEQRGGQLVCTVRLADGLPDDLLVIRAVVQVFGVTVA